MQRTLLTLDVYDKDLTFRELNFVIHDNAKTHARKISNLWQDDCVQMHYCFQEDVFETRIYIYDEERR